MEKILYLLGLVPSCSFDIQKTMVSLPKPWPPLLKSVSPVIKCIQPISAMEIQQSVYLLLNGKMKIGVFITETALSMLYLPIPSKKAQPSLRKLGGHPTFSGLRISPISIVPILITRFKMEPRLILCKPVFSIKINIKEP